jgi:APA family basic amino acid/polyamine antiporter
MIGAGVFAAIGPSADAAGTGLLFGLVIAAAVAFCNATSSAQLAALYPASGGTYVYGTERLGRPWGVAAGWCYIVGKTASCAAMALTFGTYAAPSAARPLALAAVVVLAAVDYRGVRMTVRLTRVVVAIVLLSLALVVVAVAFGGGADLERARPRVDSGGGVLEAAALLFFAFAGYARIATLGEEVRDPAVTIPRAIPIALGIALAVYASVAVVALAAVGAGGLAGSDAPLATAVRAGDLDSLTPAVRVGAAVASLGVLVSMLVGVSRTVFAMAANGDLPRPLDAVHPRHRIPHRAELAVAAVVLAVVAVTDVRGAIGFSAFGTLLYYLVANASAWTLRPDERRFPRALAGLGVVGCAVLAVGIV